MFANESAKLKVLRLTTMSVISFAGLFQSKELLNIRVCDVCLKDDHVKIHVASSKTDVYREGQDVFISRSNTNACPDLLEKYLQKANLTLNNSSDYLFRDLIYLKKTKQYILAKKAVSYTRFRELFKECLTQLGYDCSVYSLHSFHTSGATEIVKNFPNIKEREHLLKLHGRWKSDIAEDMYVQEDIQERSAVTKALRL